MATGVVTINILHVCSFFNTSNLYKNYFDSLSEQPGIKQSVYIPQYKGKNLAPTDYGTVRAKEKSTDKITYCYDECLNRINRYFLIYRTKKVYKNLLKNFQIDKDTVLHGHSLFANGGVCYHVNKKFGNEYISAFRGTDLEVYHKLPQYRGFAKKIMKNAKNIVFISHSLKHRFLDEVKDEELRTIIAEKGIVISNGMSESWFAPGVKKSDAEISGAVKFVYQGAFHKGKNIDYIIKLIEKLNSLGTEAELEIIGGGPEKENLVQQIENSPYKGKFTMKSWEKDPAVVMENYKRNSIFIMPSTHETFGISYIEALAAGLPIVYKQNDGIDGFFEEGSVGAALGCVDTEEDIKKLLSVINNYSKMVSNADSVIQGFRWSELCKKYVAVYQD